MDEDGIIQRYFAPLSASVAGAFGLMDDAATLACPPGQECVVTTDTLIAGVHFLPGDPADDIAAKALGVNLSDLAAKGGDPLVYTLSLALPADVSPRWLERFAAGLSQMQTAHGIALTGGDTTRSPGPLMISITAIGAVPAGKMVRRSGAQPGDRLFVTGTIGDSALGLRLRRGDPDCADWPLDHQARAHLLARYARPRPRTGLAAALRAHAHAAMDISDGLILDAMRLCRASGVRAIIRADKVPLSPAAASLAIAPEWLEVMLTGGDDYELLIAAPPEAADALADASARTGTQGLTAIGEVAEAPAHATRDTPVTILGADGAPLRFARPGYAHFG